MAAIAPPLLTALSDDLVDPALYADGPPFDVFDSLRRDDPVHWCERSFRWDGSAMVHDGTG